MGKLWVIKCYFKFLYDVWSDCNDLFVDLYIYFYDDIGLEIKSWLLVGFEWWEIDYFFVFLVFLYGF